MGIIYETEQIRTNSFTGFDPTKINPVKQYLKHYWNWKYLSFLHDNTKDGREKRQANQEVHIANKKMNYWYKLAKQDTQWLKELETGKKEIDTKWQQK